MRMKLYGHMNMNYKPKYSKPRPSIFRRIITRLKPKPKPLKLQNLPRNLLEEIAKKLQRNRNLQSLHMALPQTRSVFLNRKEKVKKLRALERQIYSNERSHGLVGKKFKEIFNQMKLVDPNHDITVSAETNLISAKNLLSKLKYSHPNIQNGRNVYKKMVRQKVYRRGRLVYRTLPIYYVFNTRTGFLSHMNVSGPRRHNPIFRTRMRNVKAVGMGRDRRLVLNINNENNTALPTVPANIEWVGPFANTSNQYRHFVSKNGKYKYYPNTNIIRINNKSYKYSNLR